MAFPLVLTHIVQELARGLPSCQATHDRIAEEAASAIEAVTGRRTVEVRGTAVTITGIVVSNILAADPSYTKIIGSMRFSGAQATCRIAVAAARCELCPSCKGGNFSQPAAANGAAAAFYHLDGYSCSGTVLVKKCKNCHVAMWPSYYICKGRPDVRVPYSEGGGDTRYFMATASTAVEIDLLRRFEQEL